MSFLEREERDNVLATADKVGGIIAISGLVAVSFLGREEWDSVLATADKVGGIIADLVSLQCRSSDERNGTACWRHQSKSPCSSHQSVSVGWSPVTGDAKLQQKNNRESKGKQNR